MHFKCVKELNQHFILSLSAKLNIWVMLSIVQVLKVIKLYDAVSVSVQLLECSLNKLLSLRIHLTNNNSEELIVAYSSIMIQVKDAKQDLSFILVKLDSVVFQSLEKLWELKLAIS